MPGTCSRARIEGRALPAGRARETPEHVQLRACAQPDAVEDGEPDGDADALLHAHEHHGEQRHRRQRELEEVEAGDGDQVPHAEQPQGDEDQDGGQRRQRHVPEHVGEGDEHEDERGGPQGARLGPAAGGGDGAGAGRAGVDRERPHEAGHDAAGADPEEVAPGVDVVVAALGEATGGRRGLGHDDQRHHGGERCQASQRRPGQTGQPEVGCPGLDGAEHRDPVGLEAEGSDQRRGADQADQRGRDPAVEPCTDEHDGQDTDADGERPPVHLVQVGEHVAHTVLVACRRSGAGRRIRAAGGR